MIIYLAGSDGPSQQMQLRKSLGVRGVLESAYYLKYEKQPNELGFEHHVLDSGGYTIREKGVTNFSLKTYIDYINKFNVQLAFNLDTSDMHESIKNQGILESQTLCKIIPVFHYSDFIDERWRELICEWADKYDLISAAGIAAPNKEAKRNFYEFVFSRVQNKCRVHGLGETSWDNLLRYPFYCVDSTSWLSAERFGTFYEFANGRLVAHKTLRNAAKAKEPKVTHIGQFDLGYQEQLSRSIKAFIEAEDYLTRLWTERGVDWSTWRKP